jgi:hypothetical protein
MATAREGLLEGYRVRLRTSAGEVEGYVGIENARPLRGIGLYATRDAPILAADGASIGVAHRGAFVPLVSFHGDVAEVALPPFRINGLIARAALGVKKAAPPEPLLYARAIENRVLSVANGAGSVATICTEPVAIRGERAEGVEVAQSVAGIELVGVARDNGEACRPRVLAKGRAPEGWAVPKADARITAFASSRDFYRLDSDAATCTTWSFRRPRRELVVTFPWMPPLSGPRTIVTYEVRGAAPLLPAPTALTLPVVSSITKDERGAPAAGVGEGIALCGDWTVTVVDETAEGLVVLDGVGAEAVSAYHPADVDVWYTHREACERTVLHASDRVAKMMLPARHGGC